MLYVGFTPDGRSVLSAAGCDLCISEAGTGREIRRITAERKINGVAMSPDGKLAITASGVKQGNCAVTMWELATGREIRRFEGHQEEVEAVAFSPTGKCIASGSADGTVRIWGVASGKELRSFRISGTASNTPQCLAFSPDGFVVAAGIMSSGHDRTIWMWDIQDGSRIEMSKGLFNVQTEMLPGVLAMTFMPDGGNILAATDEFCLVRYWNVDSQEFTLSFTPGFLGNCTHSRPARGVACSTDGDRIGTVGMDNTFRLWDALSFKQIQSFDTSDAQISVAFSPDARLAVTGGDEGTVRLWALPQTQAK